MALLTVKELSFAYPRQEPVFNKIGFSVQPGEILALLGPNGVGKSTLLRCLLGLTPAISGSISLADQQIKQLTRRQIAQQIAYVPQDYQVNSNLTVSDFLITARAPYLGPFQVPREKDQQLVETLLKRFNLDQLKDHPLSSLSGGQQQLVTIIKALVQEPQILILDEPMAALDLNRQQVVLTLLKSLATTGMAIILTTHLPDHVFMLDSTVGLFMPGGKLLVGNSEQLMTKENLETVYQTPLSLTYLPELHRYTCQLII
ncbi:ABC transporter ATP-binding protein [Limosilactobacillus caccae]|uniref:ABC transporter ATP-binding protein n=1 Tax=Limosilactobacillus caccae TaxID=1926284 RepID=UPI00097047DB|nr:ABC transporter ATP-binding protein [Limosilactobacillus caccae]